MSRKKLPSAVVAVKKIYEYQNEQIIIVSKVGTNVFLYIPARVKSCSDPVRKKGSYSANT